ncbi:MAG: MBL fold metallo-hydrolase RNA specificity domain-containing protein [Microthrixaceae bacterium]
MSSPILSFLGAAGTVTGSRFLIETDRARVLVDCGLFQGLKRLRLQNWEPFPVDPATIDVVLVTHAHVDHVGYLPALSRDGFDGPVIATNGTSELAAIVLPDCGHLQEEEAAYANRRGFSKHRPALPLYTEADAYESLRQFEPCAFGAEQEVAPGVHATFRPAGHILGSAVLAIRLSDHDDRTVVFSGDLGRQHHPVLCPPAAIGRADVVVVESTYGDRLHDSTAAGSSGARTSDGIAELRDAVVETVGRGGTTLIPAFAVDRTEVVLFRLRQLIESGEVPSVPVFVDSPMALNALRVYRRAIGSGAPDVTPGLAATSDPFDTGQMSEIREVEQSKGLAELDYPCIIVSASGMATGGRVLHHLARLLPDSRNCVILPGFQAAGTRGRQMADGAREVKLLGRYVRVRARIVSLGSFSIHADQGELLDWVGTAEPAPGIVYVVHGEPDAASTLSTLIEERLDVTSVVPRHLERVLLD